MIAAAGLAVAKVVPLVVFVAVGVLIDDRYIGSPESCFVSCNPAAL